MDARYLTASAAALGIAIGTLAAQGCDTGGGGDATSSTGGAGATGSGGGGAATTGSGAGGAGSSGTTGSGGGASSSSSAAGTGGGAPSCNYPPGYADGSVTFYTFDMGSSAVNCSFDILGTNPDVVAYVPFAGGQHFGAMNTADYDTAAVCGACVRVERDDGKSVEIMIVDQCPSNSNPVCTTGHIDLSKQAFLQIGAEQEGYLGTTNGGAAGKIAWEYVPCPSAGDVTFRLKEPSNQFWNQILVQGHRHPITKLEVEIDGAWEAGARQSYNYWQVGDGNMGPAPYHVRITDVNGSTLEATLSLQGGDQASGQQLPDCQ
jgi:expansin (peptidoglycan-binding protein)